MLQKNKCLILFWMSKVSECQKIYSGGNKYSNAECITHCCPYIYKSGISSHFQIWWIIFWNCRPIYHKNIATCFCSKKSTDFLSDSDPLHWLLLLRSTKIIITFSSCLGLWTRRTLLISNYLWPPEEISDMQCASNHEYWLAVL